MGRGRLTALVVLATLALTVGMTGCGDDTVDVSAGSPTGDDTQATQPPDRAADLDGTITAVTPFAAVTDDCVPAGDDPDGVVSSDDPPTCTGPDDPSLGSVLVEADPDATDGDKGSFGIDESVVILRRTSEGDVPVPFSELDEGQRVLAWHTGQVAESYPYQASAVALVIVG